jgi:hypothetical protein
MGRGGEKVMARLLKDGGRLAAAIPVGGGSPSTPAGAATCMCSSGTGVLEGATCGAGAGIERTDASSAKAGDLFFGGMDRLFSDPMDGQVRGPP